MIVFAAWSSFVLGNATDATAAPAWWHVGVEAAPTSLPPGGEGLVTVAASDLGDGEVNGSTGTPVLMTIGLPPGVTATATQETVIGGVPAECSTAPTRVTCSFKGVLNPHERLAISIKVTVGGALGGDVNAEASVEGGGTARTAAILPLNVSSQPVGFGFSSYQVGAFNENGTPETQAGAHPFQLTTIVSLNQTSNRQPVALPKDLSFRLPPGLIGDPTAVGQCSETNFYAIVEETNLCPIDSVVGVATVVANEPKVAHVFPRTVPVFNLVPAQGEPARLGFEVLGKVPVIIDTAIGSGRQYEVIASVKDATETAGLLSSEVTLWGVPGGPQHNSVRGWECVAGGRFAKQVGKPCPESNAGLSQAPFLTLPTSCATNPAEEPVISTTEADSWAEPGHYLGAEYAWIDEQAQPLGFQGCSQLPFSPQIEVSPQAHSSSTPTALEVKVNMPQQSTLEANSLAEADVRDTTVALPAGMKLNPAAATGLEACSESQVGFESVEQKTQTEDFSPYKPSCPESSKLGSVKIKTPLLSHELEGSLYLATPAPNGEANRNPFNSLIALYLIAEDPVSGVLVKLAGEGQIDEATGQLTTSFKSTPQVPFEELTLDLFGGERASLSTPDFCGSYESQATFVPWSEPTEHRLSSPGFQISSGPQGSACAGASLPFSPGFTTQNTNTQAGAFASFDLELSRPDGDQALGGVSMHLPQGVAALLSSVELCPEAQANATACPAASQIGEATAVAGLGSEPYVQRGGKVYITGPYRGAPFGLDIVTPAEAGPFNLGYISVRSKLEVNPENASVTIQSDPLPTEIRGIPLQLKRVLVTVNRAGFEFNPTNCATALKVQGTVTGAEGASSSVSSPYPVSGCSSMPFSPTLTAGAVGHGSKSNGTTFKVVVSSGGVNGNGVVQSGIARVDLQLPKQLSSRLPTLQKACTESVFNSNPASCDEGSVIGYATIHTPVLKNPLSGPAYLVSHGNAAFPDVEFVLQGEGIELVLDGKTQIKKGVTYSKFESTPDAPFTTFETILPAGPHGVLTPNVAESKHFDLCGENLGMPTTIVAQNGTTIERQTKIAIQGCGAVKAAKSRKLTRAQLLAKALKACRTRYRHHEHKRLACERLARRRYVPKPKGARARNHGARTTNSTTHARPVKTAHAHTAPVSPR